MRKEEYLASQSVKNFISWIEPLLDTPQSFVHRYVKKRGKKPYEFDSLYSAYEKYDWGYSIDEFAVSLKQSIRDNDEQSCDKACHGILKWGGVYRGNSKRVTGLKPNLCDYLLRVKERLALDLPSYDYFFPGMHMTSGFSKIYSAYIDNYIIYDGRVGAAIGLLVRAFCVQSKLPRVPDELLFAWARGLESYNPSGTSRRNPSNGSYVFPKLLSYKPEKYLENNIRANWLLSSIALKTESSFKSKQLQDRLRAIEQALFMIGYDVSGA